MARFARGKHALGQCGRCGGRAPYRQLVSDGDKPGLRVHPWCRDIVHPQEKPVRTDDATALRHPAPDLDDDSPGDSGQTLAEAMFPGQNYFGGET
jgi:hypothetical protein